ncbi:MAG: Ku protein [Microthrixaceae bacterium]
MARPTWKGSISFGLVTIAVHVYPATESHTVSFHQYRRGSGERIRHRRVGEDSGEEVPYGEIVKGLDIGEGEPVILEPEELEAAEPRRSRTIDIEDFVELEEVDPIYFRSGYYVTPADEDAAAAYALLREVMDETGRTAVGRFVLRTKEHLVAIRTVGPGLVLQTMYFADEVRDPGVLDEMEILEDVGEPDERKLEMARQLVDTLASDWDPSRYADTYRDRVMELVESKAEGREVSTTTEEPEADVIDLMSASRRAWTVPGATGWIPQGAAAKWRRRCQDGEVLLRGPLEAFTRGALRGGEAP